MLGVRFGFSPSTGTAEQRPAAEANRKENEVALVAGGRPRWNQPPEFFKIIDTGEIPLRMFFKADQDLSRFIPTSFTSVLSDLS